jgi:hypothetical protein
MMRRGSRCGFGVEGPPVLIPRPKLSVDVGATWSYLSTDDFHNLPSAINR